MEKICRANGYLNENDIDKIKDISKSLELMANFYECDVFIDILDKDSENAVVIAHAKPNRKESIYKESVIGKKALKENEPAVVETLKTGIIKKEIKALTQENRLVTQNIQPILNENKIIGTVIVEKDISNELEQDFKINISNEFKDKNSKDFLSLIKSNAIITDNLHDAILIYDNKGKLIIKNKNAVEIYKKVNKEIENVYFNEASLDKRLFNEIVQENKSEDIEIKIDDYYFKINRILINNKEIKVMEIIKDVTEEKLREIELILKSVAIREAHHRIKNSLQTVASLLRTQGRKCESDREKQHLTEAVDRVFAIATTHDLLSKADNEKVEIKEAIGVLTESINKSVKGLESNIYINGDSFYITGKQLTSLLLVINEIIQNCYKHAFDNGQEKDIKILIQINGNEKIIAIIDNGQGYNIEEAEKKNSLGLKIIKSYMEDGLKGSFKVSSSEKGTQTILKFKIEE